MVTSTFLIFIDTVFILIGCMAERVRHKLLREANAVDVVAGPDSYRDLPRLLAVTRTGRSAINVQLSLEETYADVTPVRLDPIAKSAFVYVLCLSHFFLFCDFSLLINKMDKITFYFKNLADLFGTPGY